jgi:hypothetical protein
MSWRVTSTEERFSNAEGCTATPAAPAGKPALVFHYLDINTSFSANWP